MEPGRRARRVAELVQEEISRILIGEFQDASSGLISVTRVEMSPDLLSARVFVRVFGADPQGLLDHLTRSTGRIRRSLASKVELKYNPRLTFVPDTGPDELERIDALIEKAKRHDE